MQIGTNTEFPKDITIPEALNVPAGNVFKFALYGIGVAGYKFKKSESTWNICKGDTFYFNHPKDISFNSGSIVAMSSAVGLGQSGEILEGPIKSLIPGDTSLCAGKGTPDYHPELKTLRGVIGKPTTYQGETFSDITYVTSHIREHALPTEIDSDGYVCSIPISVILLFYKSA
ncbi:2535_t:CDS:2 [Ambispora leptoticha]|uniref:2535_t:CDS:1 n=1 Tax=Ambispora leptoticha TaxID=144679 RepID=A0A9N9G3M9_9GLOM|nr:2535_t:CDS:2 [Ambispora leptoticha]